MIKLTAKIRQEMGRKTSALKNSGRIPAVIYGHGIENASLDLDYKEFTSVLKEAGESSLIEMHVEGEKEKRLVLVHDLQKDAVSDKYIHVDFFETSAKEEVEVGVPLIIEGTSLAVKDLGGTLVQNIYELEIKAMPGNLPHDIKVSIDGLNTFEDRILVKDLILPENIKVLVKPEEIVVSVVAPTNVEEDLAKEIEEKVEDVEKVEKEKKVEDVVEDTPA
ncbi:MAG: 50S ribosomal protein L25 [Candidatus Staskawiczbacteria bacterium]|jgi:large subunit ribosomal protein L25